MSPAPPYCYCPPRTPSLHLRRSSGRTGPGTVLTSVSLQMYIALASVHALVLCGLQFIACVRGQWTGRPGGAASLARAAVGGEGGGGLRFQRKSSVPFVSCRPLRLGQNCCLVPFHPMLDTAPVLSFFPVLLTQVCWESRLWPSLL